MFNHPQVTFRAVTSPPTSTDGQPLGARGIQTRQRILEAVAGSIEQQGLRGLRLADVAAEVGFSPPAFYQYFNDLDEAILALCEEVGHLLPPFSFRDTDGEPRTEGTHDFVARFFDYWDKHRAVLWTRNVAVTSGDPRFQDVRNEALSPIVEALRASIQAGQEAGQIDPAISPTSLGAALIVMLDRLAMLKPLLFENWADETEDDLVDAVAFIFDRTLGMGSPAQAGRTPARSAKVANTAGRRRKKA
jgi:AcrR family transcriptional regulator